jgi:hypothetical protein
MSDLHSTYAIAAEFDPNLSRGNPIPAPAGWQISFQGAAQIRREETRQDSTVRPCKPFDRCHSDKARDCSAARQSWLRHPCGHKADNPRPIPKKTHFRLERVGRCYTPPCFLAWANPTERHLNLAVLVQILDLPKARAKGTEDSDGCRPRLTKRPRALRSLLGGLPPSFASVVCTSRSKLVFRVIGGRSGRRSS